ncbi:MAG: choice-of-anchor D domain-containing protein [Candidatus Cloacimonetes bacterium]|jgi:hypothetical protein|nr:choice-of-anchor D domain-containing protein [Candidatus Cloacimonadota bacterium]
MKKFVIILLFSFLLFSILYSQLMENSGIAKINQAMYNDAIPENMLHPSEKLIINSASRNSSILYVNAHQNGDITFKTAVASLPNVGTFTEFDAYSATPDVAYLLGYDVVIVASNFVFADPMTLGNNLASYVDQGGKVCMIEGSFSSGYELEGLIMDPAYSPLTVAPFSLTTVSCNSFVTHPITSNVSYIETGLYTFSYPQGNGVSLGIYGTGDHVAAYNPDKAIVAINVFPSDGFWGGDFIQMISNTIDWLIGPEISVTPSSMTENLNVGETSTQILNIENIITGAADLDAFITIEASAEDYFQSFLDFPQYEQRGHSATERTTTEIANGYPDKFQQLIEPLDSRSIIFSDDMESGVGGWTTQVYGVDDLWHQTNLSFNSPVTSWWCGIEAQGNYATGNRINTALISPAIDLTTISIPVGLYFYESYDTEIGWDHCLVDVTIDGGSSWTQLRGGYGSAPTGNSGGWIFTALDLTPYLGNMLQIRFYFDTNDGGLNDYAGWFVDDVIVTTGNPLVPWLAVDTYNVTIPGQSSADVNVDFDASAIFGGTYTANIVIDSNDPVTPQVIVPVTMEVTGIPDIEADVTSFDFGSLEYGQNATDNLTISNAGTDWLNVTDIVSDNPDFTVDITSFSLYAMEQQVVIVTFTPSSAGVITSDLTIYSNDPDEPEVVIALSGECTAAEIVITPASFEENIAPDVIVDNTLTIENTGLADLNYNISIEYMIPTDRERNYGDYADRSRENSSTISLFDRQSASASREFPENRAAGDILGVYSGMPPNTVSNMGMVWVGDLLYSVNFGINELTVYDISTQSVIATYPTHVGPFGITWDGSYLWIGDQSGNVWAYNLDGSSAGFSFSCPDIQFPALTWDGSYFVTSPIFTPDPTIYKLDATGFIIDSYTGSIGMDIWQFVWVPEHMGGNLWMTNTAANTVVQMNLADTDGTYNIISGFTLPPGEFECYSITHHNFNLWWADWDGPLYEIDDGIAEFYWLSIDITSGTLGTGISDDITVTIDANETDNLGVYEASLVIVSNDPDDLVVYVPVTLTVNYPPEIILPDDFTFEEDDGLMVDFDSYITDPNSSPYVLSATGNTNVTVDIVGSEVTFGAPPDWYGTETLTFTVNDGQTDTDVVDIIVTPVNDDPTIVLPNDFTFDEDDGLVVDFTGFVDDIDLDVLTLTVAGNTEITVDIVDLEVTFGATANWNGTETLTFTVDDGQGERVSISTSRKTATKNEGSRATADDVVDVIVLPVNDDPTIVLPEEFTFEEDDGLMVDFTDFIDDIDPDDLTLTVTGNTEITVDIVGFEVTFGATVNWNGTETLTFIVDDNVTRATAEDDVDVIVTPVNDEPVLIGFLPEELTFTVEQDSMVTFSVDVEDIDSTIDYEWFVDDVLQTESIEEFVHIFAVVGDIEIKSIASDEDYEIETIWIVQVEEGSGAGNELLPVTSVLSQNYPNPFNPTTTISFDIKENETGNLNIYNMKGQLVLTRSFGAGRHNFLWDAASCSSGIYFYKLTTPSYFHTRKMILLK